VAPGIRQRSTRAGALSRRILKRVYLPILAGWLTKSSITVPDPKVRRMRLKTTARRLTRTDTRR
jgi:hypothetical protein